MSEAKKLHVVKAGADAASRTDESHVVLLGLSAAIVSVAEERPRVLAVRRSEGADALPFGTFDPIAHRTLESGLRDWVQEQTGLQLGYVEQLYTFGDRGRHLTRPGEGPRVLSVGYLALTRLQDEHGAPDTEWRDWYLYFPWEDWREDEARDHRRTDPAAPFAVRGRCIEPRAARAPKRTDAAVLRHRRHGLGRGESAGAL